MIDSSPKMGRELFAILETVILPRAVGEVPVFTQRQIGVVAMSHKHTTGADKGITLLHSVWSEYGGTKGALDCWMASVRGVTSDLGTEWMLGQARNFVPMFVGVAPGAADAEFAFPGALRVPGWNHLCHGMIETVAEQCLPWFATWSAAARQVVNFLAGEDYVEALTHSLLAKGLGDLAAPLRTLPSRFLDWRWGTLVQAARGLLDRRDALLRGWDGAYLRGTTEDFRAAARAATDNEAGRLFWVQTSFVYEVFVGIEHLRTWGGGCDCHDGQRRQGIRVDCRLAGRRLPAATARVAQCAEALLSLDEQMALRHTWVQGSLAAELAASTAALRGRLELKFGWLRQLPYAVVHAGSQEGASSCLASFDRETGGRAHHPVSCRFLGAASALRQHVEICARGGGCSDLLAMAVSEYAWLRLDESPSEGMHRDIALEKSRAHAIRVPFAAATVRMQQNIAAWKAVKAAGGRALGAFVRAWTSYKKLAAAPSAAPASHLWSVPRSLRALPPSAVAKSVYRLDARSREPWGHIAALFTDALAVPKVDEVQWLQLNCLRTFVKAHCVYSLPAVGLDDLPANAVLSSVQTALQGVPVPELGQIVRGLEEAQGRKFFRVLEPNVLRVKRPRGELVQAGSGQALLERLGEWSPVGTRTSAALFPSEAPTVCDLLDFAPFLAWRESLFEWSASNPSDVAGCFDFARRDPHVAAQALEDGDVATMPPLLVWEHLARGGWRSGREPSEPHDGVDVKTLCLRDGLVRTVPYARCVLALPSLLARGLVELPCRASAGYYRAILAATDPGSILVGQRAGYYAERMGQQRLQGVPLAALDDLEVEVEPLPPGPPLPLPPPSAPGLASLSVEVPEVAAIGADGEVVELAPAPPAALWAPPAHLPAEWQAIAQQFQDFTLPSVVEGIRVGIGCHAPIGGQTYIRRVIRCPFHDDCVRRRNCSLGSRFGQREILAFLGAWIEAGSRWGSRSEGKRAHMSFEPTAQAVEAYGRARGWF